MFISSLANQVNSNLDNIVVGAYLGSSEVAVYSVALTIFGMFSQIGSAAIRSYAAKSDRTSKREKIIILRDYVS